MSRAVLDASALMAAINQEPGSEKLTPAFLRTAAASAVNVAEVYGKLLHRGFLPEHAWYAATAALERGIEFTTEQARIAGDLVPITKSLGLSLGDRACLALGITLSAPVYTADRSWKNLDVGVPIHAIR